MNNTATGNSVLSLGNTTNSSSNFYQYDALDHLTNANNGQILLTYDGDGNRMSKKADGTTTYYLVDDVNPSGYAQVLEEFSVFTQLSGQPVLTRVYNYGLGLISQQQFDTNTLLPSALSYYGYDGHGSVRFLMDTNANITDTYAYDAFGNLIATNGTTPNNYLYSGQQWDPDLGLYFNRARYVATTIGRFMTMDTYAGNDEDPLSLHKYLYGADDPVNKVDPSGHMTADELKEKILDHGTTAMDALKDALETIAEGGEPAEALSGALATLGEGIVPDILYGKAQNAAIILGQEIELGRLYPLARDGTLDPYGTLARLLDKQNALQVEFTHDSFSSVRTGIAPFDIVDPESSQWIPFYFRWNDLGGQQALVSVFPLTWNPIIKKFGPDYGRAIPLAPNVPESILFHSTGYVYGLDLVDSLNGP